MRRIDCLTRNDPSDTRQIELSKPERKNGCFKKFEDLGEAGATSLDAAAFSGIANWLAVL
jgi:hypothetical protein